VSARLKKRRLLEPLEPLSSGEEPMEVNDLPEEAFHLEPMEARFSK